MVSPLGYPAPNLFIPAVAAAAPRSAKTETREFKQTRLDEALTGRRLRWLPKKQQYEDGLAQDITKVAKADSTIAELQQAVASAPTAAGLLEALDDRAAIQGLVARTASPDLAAAEAQAEGLPDGPKPRGEGSGDSGVVLKNN
ncbi:hypothetical protein N0V85_008768 [Neurospora sp. IMI 360204]|nr:hypothetical protein N0V85_008768 [Neurospora sp. IMI 360204]